MAVQPPTDPFNKTSVKIVHDTLTLVSTLALFGGLLFLFISVTANYYKYDFLASILANIGTGFITAAAMSWFLERYTKNAMFYAQTELARNMESKINSILRTEIGAVVEANRLFHGEILKSLYNDRVVRDVFAKGLLGAFSAWSGSDIHNDFFETQINLDMLLKDGKSLFKDKREMLKKRFANGSVKTRVLIVHPDYRHLDAVASMDEHKINPISQKKDSLDAVQKMHGLKNELIREGIDCTKNVEFIGYKMVPTWAGYIGDAVAYIHLYFTRPYRGVLNTLFISAKNDEGNTSELYRSYLNDFNEIVRLTESEGGNYDLWNYDIGSQRTG